MNTIDSDEVGRLKEQLRVEQKRNVELAIQNMELTRELHEIKSMLPALSREINELSNNFLDVKTKYAAEKAITDVQQKKLIAALQKLIRFEEVYQYIIKHYIS